MFKPGVFTPDARSTLLTVAHDTLRRRTIQIWFLSVEY